jgi:hypothetical protein
MPLVSVQSSMGSGSVPISSRIELEKQESHGEHLDAVYRELEDEESWERKSSWARALSAATIALMSICCWTAIIALVRFLW